jgi:hypothetical protein
MLLPGLRVGLQEWAVCVRALKEGRTCLAIRKGGIHEPRGGFFTLEHQQFVLLPTWLHQDAARLRADYAGDFLAGVGPHPAPGRIPVTAWAEAAQVWKVTDLAKIRSLGPELLWNDAEIASRFNYRGQPFLYVCALRIHRLPGAVDLFDHPSYGGCRSWIQLNDPVPTDGSQAVVDDAEFARRLAAIAGILGA